MRIKSQDSGFKELFEKMDKIKAVKNLEMRVQTKATSGEIKTSKSKSRVESRPAGKNARIWNSLKKRKRKNPTYLDTAEQSKIQKIVSKSINSYAKNPDKTRLKADLQPAADAIKENIVSHVENQKGETGHMKSKKTKYYYIKKALYGETRFLIRSGQLLKSLVAKVVIK